MSNKVEAAFHGGRLWRAGDAVELTLPDGTTARWVLTEPNGPIQRLLALCAEWDRLSKGESPTTKAIRAALDGEAS